MIPVLRQVAQLNIKYRKKKGGPHNRCLHRGPTLFRAVVSNLLFAMSQRRDTELELRTRAKDILRLETGAIILKIPKRSWS